MSNTMATHFTLGIEEEFQIVDRNSGQLVSCQALLEKSEASKSLLSKHIRAEALQPCLELITNVCPDVTALRLDLQQLHAQLAALVASENLALISAGTHPNAHWQDQQYTQNGSYDRMEREFQDVGRSLLIFGLHIHVSISSHELAIPLMNQLRTWLPHLLALSSNSPFWANRNSGTKSYRSIVWKRFPRTGVPNLFASSTEYDRFVDDLIRADCIDSAKRIWWDIRPHPQFNTIEFRVCDMPATLKDTLALVSFCQALVAKLTWLHQHNITIPELPAHYIDENKRFAVRDGLDAHIVDFIQNRNLSMRDSLHESLNFVDDMLGDLDIRHEIDYLRELIDSPCGTGADRQLAVYGKTGSIHAVTYYLMQQTMQGYLLV